MTTRLVQIKDFPDYYVTKKGEIYSSYRSNVNIGGILRKLKTPSNCEGYPQCRLYRRIRLKNNMEKIICKTVKIHRIVAETFLEKPDKKSVVIHLNGNNIDNRVENLAWTTMGKAIERGYRLFGRVGYFQGKTGSEHPESIPVLQIKDGVIINKFGSIKQAEKMTGIIAHNISKVCKNMPRYKTAGGYKWKYEGV